MSTNCRNCGKSFEILEEDTQFYKKIGVPAPTWCPQCRLMRKMTWRNERTLYKRKCDLCEKDMITIYAPGSVERVYCTQCWYSDALDSTEYGAAYDFSKPFFPQFSELLRKTPHLNLMLTSVEGSEYNNYSLYLKNCYMIFGSWRCEDVAYSQRVVDVKDSLDSLRLNQCELGYEDVYCTQCHHVTHAFDSHQCSDSAFLTDCRDVSRSFGCVNLRNKTNHIFNTPYSRAEYEKEMQSIDLGSHKTTQDVERRFRDFVRQYPKPSITEKNSTNVSGDFITNCRNCKNCFYVNEGQDSKYCYLIEKNFSDCYDIWIAMENVEQCYEVIAAATNNQLSKFSAATYHNSSHLEYCYACVSSRNCFGCAGLKNKEYCILNTQYTKEEYESLVPKIIEQMKGVPYTDKKGRAYTYGEFFPTELSPFAYNETIAQEYFPLTKEEIEERGYVWREPETKHYAPTLTAAAIPDNIKDVNDSIINEIISCEHTDLPHGCNEQCTTAFKITPQELQLYRRINLPVPRLCPNCRHYARIKEHNSFTLWRRTCMCVSSEASAKEDGYRNTTSHFHGDKPCPNEFETPYAPESLEVVYCEQCYQAEVV